MGLADKGHPPQALPEILELNGRGAVGASAEQGPGGMQRADDRTFGVKILAGRVA